jgi:hypothetical protein
MESTTNLPLSACQEELRQVLAAAAAEIIYKSVQRFPAAYYVLVVF